MLKPDHLQRTIPLVFSGFITPRLMEKQLKTVRHLFDDSRACIGLFHLLVFVILIGCTMCMPVSGRSSAGIGPTLYPMGFRFTSYTVNEGLSQNLVSAVIQDHQGFIWIGTKDGLNLFDGHEFTHFRYDPFESGSLKGNYITCIYEDPSDRLWIGTLDGGLHLFDRSSRTFIRFFHEPGNHNSLDNNYIQAIESDHTGNLWVATNTGGLHQMVLPDGGQSPAPENTLIVRYHDKGFPEQNAWINTLFCDRSGQLWVGTRQNTFVFDPSDENPVFKQVPFLRPENGTTGHPTAGSKVFLEDASGEIWMGNMLGLFRLDRDREVFVPYTVPGSDPLSKSVVAASMFYNQGREEIWFSSGESITILHPPTGISQKLSFQEHQSDGLQKGQYITMFSDKGGGLWIGSNGHGLTLFDPRALKFEYPEERLPVAVEGISSTRDLSIRAFYQDRADSNVLWLGANQGLFKVDRPRSVMEPTGILDGLPRGERLVFSIQSDEQGILWLGSAIGLIRYDPVTKSHRAFPTGLSEGESGIEPRVGFVHLGDEEIWVLTHNTIARFDHNTEQFEHFRYNHEPLDNYRDASFPFLYPDHLGNFWIGARNGLHYFEKNSGRLTTYVNDINNPQSLSFNHVVSILPDPLEPEKILWIGTGGGGLNRFNIAKGLFRHYSTAEGLANDMVYGILPDDEGNLWISTNRGLSRFNPMSETFTNYTASEGLQSNEFNGGAFYKSPAGELFFGGIKGYNRFFPSRIKENNYQAPVVFTDFRVLTNKGENPGQAEPINISENPEIVLDHRHNHFTITFSSLDYRAPHKNRFMYSLTEQGEHWIELGNQRSVTFTDLKPGRYTLRVRGTNNDGVWSNREARSTIHIATPWFGKPWMITIYILVALGLVAGFRIYELSRLRLRNRVRIAQIETNQLKELDHLKSVFFANISHEFRTPLTLLKGPVEQMLEENPDPKRKKTLIVMQHSATRLMQLINQLLDLSRLESGGYPVKAGPGNLSGFMKGLVMSFASLAEQKNIGLRYEESRGVSDPLLMKDFYFDPDILEKILTNLLSNAFKFTPKHGRVTVSVCLRADKSGKKHLEISVADTGIGIPADKLPLIYDRFYQVDPSPNREHGGTGVGLAYVKELVRVHNASIVVKSEAGHGSTFSLRFPCGKSHLADSQIREKNQEAFTKPFPADSRPPINPGRQPGKKQTPAVQSSQINRTPHAVPLILVVEDHVDVRHYIASSLGEEYHVAEAPNAADGLLQAGQIIPDLIISDVMMPKMDGLAFCEHIKTDEKTSHIPVILLTALAGDADRIVGLETGADDYLTKPFNPKELKIRVKNLIETRRALREKFSEKTFIVPGEISVTSRDQAFMERVLGVMEKNIGNETFSVEELGLEVGMSQSQFNRKLKAVINQSPKQFIRSVRMHRAMDLVGSNAGNVSEIAYMTGYADPGYFTRTFKAFFGHPPSAYYKKSQE